MARFRAGEMTRTLLVAIVIVASMQACRTCPTTRIISAGSSCTLPAPPRHIPIARSECPAGSSLVACFDARGAASLAALLESRRTWIESAAARCHQKGMSSSPDASNGL